MKQILQSLKTGKTELAEIPVPKLSSGQLLIATSCTLVSSGTEKMMIDFGRASWVGKFRQQPDKVKAVIDKIKTDGIGTTLNTVLTKLDQPLPLGYCNVGRVLEIPPGFNGYKINDRVINNGKHAEIVSVPFNLCAKVPDVVSDEEAAFTILGAIALQGIRLSQPTLGEAYVVTGLGLVGLLTVQLLRAHGCRVLGIDYDPVKLKLAKDFGAEVVNLSIGEDPVIVAENFSRGKGVDAVIIAASTNSNLPIHQAATMCRKRGRIVLVGVAGLNLIRDDFFKKEITFQVSASYGPGRYDPNYEDMGNDYPIGFVRWTQQRNFEAVLDMMAEGKLNVKPLISHRFSILDGVDAYNLITESDHSLGILIKYPGIDLKEDSRRVNISGVLSTKISRKSNPRISFIGSGSYATSTLIPAFKLSGAYLHSISSIGGVSSFHAGRKFGFNEVTTDAEQLFIDEKVDAVVVATRHNSHADYVAKSLKSHKHIFVEKPLCISIDELNNIENVYSEISANGSAPILMVGFNRRFSPQIKKIKSLIESDNNPKSFILTVNSGSIPNEHWAQKLEISGGRIIGEVCHFIDLLRFLTGEPVTSWKKSVMKGLIGDTLSINLSFKNGSIGTIHYFSNGSKSYPKERLEIFSNGKILQLDNYRRLTGYGWPNFKKMNLWQQDKGQKNCAREFIEAIRGAGVSPIPVAELLEVSRLAIEIANG